MSDTNKPEKNIDGNDDILNSNDLFDLDMPIDEPPEETAESVQILEKDIEHLLNRDNTNKQEEPESLVASDNQDMDSASTHPPAKSISEPIITAAPAATGSKRKNVFALANTLMFTMELVAILVASLAAWLGLDASGKISNLENFPPKLQQRIQVLEQRQKQQNKAINSQLENLQQQLNALSKVIASKSTEQWRAAIETESPIQSKQRTIAAIKTILPAFEAKQLVHPVVIHKKSSAANNSMAAHALIPPPKPVVASPPLTMHEVLPGSVKGWVVNIYSVESQDTAERQIRKLATKNIHAKYIRVLVKGKTWYRIRVSGFKNKRSAMVFKKFLEEYHGIQGAWYNKLK